MKQFLVKFQAEYYCQGYEYCWFTKLITATSFEAACGVIKHLTTKEWELGTPRYFINETINN